MKWLKRVPAFVLLVYGLSGVASAIAAAPCCSITSIDLRSGTVTARELTGKRTFQFKVADAALLKSLKVGQSLFADTAFRKVSLRNDAAPCCAIINVRSAEPAGIR